jgi:hypothetical protein
MTVCPVKHSEERAMKYLFILLKKQQKTRTEIIENILSSYLTLIHIFLQCFFLARSKSSIQHFSLSGKPFNAIAVIRNENPYPACKKKNYNLFSGAVRYSVISSEEIPMAA